MKLKLVLFILIFLPKFAFANACPLNNNFTAYNNISPRLQWMSNHGYCGEVSIISAGLFYGQYVSQYDARLLANKNLSDSKSPQLEQILIGKPGDISIQNNIINAANNMHFNFEEYDDSTSFLQWVKNHVIQKHPVIIGIYDKGAADNEYDHIVPVFAIGNANNDDIIYFSDNGLYDKQDASPNYCYSYPFKQFLKNRVAANNSSDIYSLSDSSNGEGNFGLAITGVKATGVALLPIQITTTPASEFPEIADGFSERPQAQTITLNISVLGLSPNKNYALYKYSSFDDLPKNDDFSKSMGTPSKAEKINITNGNSYKKQEQILSSETAIYRAVKLKD